MLDSAAIAVPTPNDHHLVRQVASGDERAFDELYQLYGQAVFNYVLRLINDPAVAEELLQDVFLAAWQGAGRFREQASVKTWLLRIAHHRTVSWLRRKRLATSLDEAEDIAIDDPIDEHLAQTWRAEQIRQALDQLSVKHRAVVELTFVHELSYAEIAEIMNCPIGTVKSRMSYALAHLSRIIQALPPHD